MSIEIDGFDELADELDQLAESFRSAEGEYNVPIEDVFTEEFMRTHTEVTSIRAFFDESPWDVETQDDLQQIPEDKLDAYVRDHTGFKSWEAMLKTAGREWVTRQLGL